MIGAILRYSADFIPVWILNEPDPIISTIFVNLTGCFIIGWVAGRFHSNSTEEITMRLFLMTGILGSFTTFSGYTIEALNLLGESFLLFLLYFLGQPAIGLLMLIAGSRLSSFKKTSQ
jgi:CrcB protein